jgi:hypothetical protein
VILNQNYGFLPGPMATSNYQLEQTDMYIYVRYNGQFTPPELITAGMTGWQIGEDKVRHNTWHGNVGVTWFDVLTNKITVVCALCVSYENRIDRVLGMRCILCCSCLRERTSRGLIQRTLWRLVRWWDQRLVTLLPLLGCLLGTILD